jgi:hypothetical protein
VENGSVFLAGVTSISARWSQYNALFFKQMRPAYGRKRARAAYMNTIKGRKASP